LMRDLRALKAKSNCGFLHSRWSVGMTVVLHYLAQSDEVLGATEIASYADVERAALAGDDVCGVQPRTHCANILRKLYHAP
jgi:hypothetical protein